MFKLFHGAATLLFFTMAAIQLNDPDPLYWVAVYFATTVLSAGLCFGVRLNTLSKITIGMALAGFCISGSGFIEYLVVEDYASIYEKMSGEKPYVESAREFGGLLIVAVYLAIFEAKVGGPKIS